MPPPLAPSAPTHHDLAPTYDSPYVPLTPSEAEIERGQASAYKQRAKEAQNQLERQQYLHKREMKALGNRLFYSVTANIFLPIIFALIILFLPIIAPPHGSPRDRPPPPPPQQPVQSTPLPTKGVPHDHLSWF